MFQRLLRPSGVGKRIHQQMAQAMAALEFDVDQFEPDFVYPGAAQPER